MSEMSSWVMRNLDSQSFWELYEALSSPPEAFHLVFRHRDQHGGCKEERPR